MQKGFIPILVLIGILIIGAGIGGVYFLGKLPVRPANQEPKACTQEAKICPDGSSVGRTGLNCEFSPCPSVTPTKSIDETANWKTYTNVVISFKYPQNWDYYDYRLEKIIDITFGPKELVKINRERLDNPNIAALIGGKAWPVEIKSFNGNSYFYGPNEVSFISDAQKRVTSKEITVNGKNAVRYVIEFNYNAPYISKGDTIEVVVVVEKDAKSYSITLSDQKYKAIFNQILSTFKFLP